MRSAIDLQITDGVGRITLQRPERGEAIDETFCSELREVVDEVTDAAPRVVLIRATGRHLSVGGDVKAFRAQGASLPALIRRITGDLTVAISRLLALPAPVVVEARGVSAGAAVALVAAADVAIASESATFVAAYTRIGLSPDMGASQLLPRRVGSRRATDFYLLNETWTAEEARSHGLLTEVVADDLLEAETEAIVERLATGPTAALAATKHLLWNSWDRPLEQQLEHEARAITGLAATHDVREGLAALAERRPPEFQGR